MILTNLRQWWERRSARRAKLLPEQRIVVPDDEESIQAAPRESIPEKSRTISAEQLRELDRLYEKRSETGRPVAWGSLVEALREIRRAVESGVVVTVEGAPPMRSWQSFYNWAHGRYHMLEDGYDKWIGNDD